MNYNNLLNINKISRRVRGKYYKELSIYLYCIRSIVGLP